MTKQNNNSTSTYEPWLDSKEAALVLGVHPKTMERYAREQGAPGYFKMNRWYFMRSELDNWIHEGVDSRCHPCRVN